MESTFIAIDAASKLIQNNNYYVEFSFNGDIKTMSFSRITSINSKSEFETIVEGNGPVHIIPKYVSSPNTLVFEKGVSTESGIEKYFQVGRFVDYGLIKVLKNGNVIKQYGFMDGVITEWELDDLDALQSKALVQKFKVAYTQFFCSGL